jgi:hypothetical protein
MKAILGVLLTALAVFVWEAISWTALGWHDSAYRSFRNEPRMTELFAPTIRSSETQASSGHGIYVMPFMPRQSKHQTKEEFAVEQEKYEKALRDGPFVYAIIRPGSREVSMTNHLVLSFLRLLLCSALLAGMLSQAMLSYGARIAFTAAAGVFASLMCDGSMWIWFENPLRDTLVNLADHFVAWVIGGAVLGHFVGKEVVITKGM